MTDSPDRRQDTCQISSTIDHSGRAACLLEWGPIQALLTPPVVLTTARDLMAAATAAETDIALIQALRHDIGADDHVLGAMLTAVRTRRPTPTGTTALRIAAVAGARTGQALVHIARGSMTGELTADGARTMAQHWIETATAAAIDARMRYALGEWDHLTPADIEELFALLQKAQGRTTTEETR